MLYKLQTNHLLGDIISRNWLWPYIYIYLYCNPYLERTPKNRYQSCSSTNIIVGVFRNAFLVPRDISWLGVILLPQEPGASDHAMEDPQPFPAVGKWRQVSFSSFSVLPSLVLLLFSFVSIPSSCLILHLNPPPGVGALLGRFQLTDGPSKPSQLAVQFTSEGSTLSGCDIQLVGTGYRLSLVKKRFAAGQFICQS